MPQIKTITANTHRELVADINLAKAVDTKIKGLQNDLTEVKGEALKLVSGLFYSDITAETPEVITNFKIEATRMEEISGVRTEVPDGIVQCQMKVESAELDASILAEITDPNTREALTGNAQVVDLVDKERVLRWLASNPDTVAITASGDSIAIKFKGNAYSVDGLSFKTVTVVADKFLDKVRGLTADKRTAAMPVIKKILAVALHPTLVFGNRSAAGAAGE